MTPILLTTFLVLFTQSTQSIPIPVDDALAYYYDDYGEYSQETDFVDQPEDIDSYSSPSAAASSSEAVSAAPAAPAKEYGDDEKTKTNIHKHRIGIGNIVGLFGNLGVGVIDHLTGKVVALREKLDSQRIQDRIDDVVEAKATVAENIVKATQPLIEHTVEKVPKLMSATLQALDDIIHSKGVKKVVDGTKNLAKSIDRKISDVASDGSNIKQSFADAKKATVPLISKGLQDFKDQIPLYSRLASSAIGVYTDQLKEVFDTFGSTFHCSLRCRDMLSEAKKECEIKYKCSRSSDDSEKSEDFEIPEINIRSKLTIDEDSAVQDEYTGLAQV